MKNYGYLVLLFVLFSIFNKDITAQNPKWIIYNTSNSPLPTNDNFAVAIDGENTKWIATDDEGLVKIVDTVWTIYNTSNSSIPSDNIHVLETDSDNNLWLAAAHQYFGLAKYDGLNWTVYNEFNSPLSGNSINSIIIDSMSTKWILIQDPNSASWLNLVEYYEDSTWNFYQGHYTPDVWGEMIGIDSGGNLWTAVGVPAQNLYKFNRDTLIIYNSTVPMGQ